jgi:transposase-like protein
METCALTVPEWVPVSAVRYLAHTEAGKPIRALARDAGCHASTILRQIRKLECRREDLLVDEALMRLSRKLFQAPGSSLQPQKPEPDTMIVSTLSSSTADTDTFEKEAARILRRMTENGAVLAVAQEMEKAVVVRENSSGTTTRTAVVERAVAEAMALKNWITCDTPGRISRYCVTSAGRSALARLLARRENAQQVGFAEAQAGFAEQEAVGAETSRRRGSARNRYCVPDSPLTLLARRRDKDGNLFLSDDLVAAGERLREDFELSQMEPGMAQNWDAFLTGRTGPGVGGADNPSSAPSAARSRMASALRELGPGLGDVALRCCCYLEGLETAERRMGWSARSGKIVLRIALQRLKRHYEALGHSGQMIG